MDLPSGSRFVSCASVRDPGGNCTENLPAAEVYSPPPPPACWKPGALPAGSGGPPGSFGKPGALTPGSDGPPGSFGNCFTPGSPGPPPCGGTFLLPSSITGG